MLPESANFLFHLMKLWKLLQEQSPPQAQASKNNCPNDVTKAETSHEIKEKIPFTVLDVPLKPASNCSIKVLLKLIVENFM